MWLSCKMGHELLRKRYKVLVYVIMYNYLIYRYNLLYL